MQLCLCAYLGFSDMQQMGEIEWNQMYLQKDNQNMRENICYERLWTCKISDHDTFWIFKMNENKRKSYRILHRMFWIILYLCINVCRVMYYVALLIDNEHHSHSLEFLSEPTEPELGLYTCRAVGSCLLHIFFVLRVFLLPTRLWGQEWHIMAKGVHKSPIPTRCGFTQLFGYLWRWVRRCMLILHVSTVGQILIKY